MADVSILSLRGVVCNVLIGRLVFGVVIYNYTSPNYLTRNPDVKFFEPDISVGVGIFLLSLAGHACLPSCYANMKNPDHFDRILDICFVIMFLLFACLGVGGYVVYGPQVDVVINHSMATYPGSWPVVTANIL